MSKVNADNTYSAIVDRINNANLMAGSWDTKPIRYESVLKKAAALKVYAALPAELLCLKIRDAIRAALKDYTGGDLPQVTYNISGDEIHHINDAVERLKAAKAGIEAVLSETKTGMEALLLTMTLPDGKLETAKKK